MAHKKEVDFIDNVLKIRDMDTLFQFYYYGPKQWIDFLGETPFLKHHKFLIKLHFIWLVTVHEGNPITWDLYMESRDDSHAGVTAVYMKEVNHILVPYEKSPLKVPVISVKVPKVPVVTSSVIFPPAHTKVFPVIKA